LPQPGITIAFDFQNHAGLVDLNAASAEALKTGFLALGVPGEMAAVLAKEAEEYRTTNLTGATSEFQDGVVGGLKHGPFETPLELLDFQLLKHIDPDQLLGSFTVLSRSGTIHVQSAPGLIREAAERAAATSIFSSAIRLPAFSVNAVLHDASRHGLAISGAADYVTADASLILTGPVRLGLGEKSLTSRPTADDCVSFFTPQTLAALRRLF
jgi:general secretion pathway protein K